MKRRIFKRYIKGKRGGQRYWINRYNANRIPTKVYSSIHIGHIPKKYKNIQAWSPLEKRSDNIFIGNWQDADNQPIELVSTIIGHEELHNILKKEINPEASAHLDLITVPPVFDQSTGKVYFQSSLERSIQPKRKIFKILKDADKTLTTKTLNQWYKSRKKDVEFSKSLIHNNK